MTSSTDVTPATGRGHFSPLWVSLGIIGVVWLYRVSTASQAPTISPDFGEFMLILSLKKLVVFAAIWGLLRYSREGFAALGVTRERLGKHIFIGVGFGVLIFLFLLVGLTAVLESIVGKPSGQTQTLAGFLADPKKALLFLPMGIFGGGIVEELERIFVLTRFEKWLGRRGLILGLVLSTVVFGASHLYQGVGSGISAGLSGLAFGLVYLRKRSGVEAMSAHAFGDVLAIIAATLVAQPR